MGGLKLRGDGLRGMQRQFIFAAVFVTKSRFILLKEATLIEGMSLEFL